MANSHLKALMSKNWILWKRNLCCSILEIVIPVLFMFLFGVFRNVDPVETIESRSYYDGKEYVGMYNRTAELALQILSSKCQQERQGGRVGLAPAGNDYVDAVMNRLGDTFEYITFDDEEEMENYVTDNDYSLDDKRLCFGVVFNNMGSNNNYEYSLRFNTSTQPGSEDIPSTNEDRILPAGKQDLDSLEKYIFNGFLTMQWIIDNEILKQETNDDDAIIEEVVTSMKTPDYVQDDLISSLEGTAQSLIALPILLPYLRMVNGIMREKEKRIKEGMKIMGLKSSAFFFSWFIFYFIIFTLVSFLSSLVFFGTFLEYSNFGLIFLWHWFFSLATMAMGFFSTAFFSKAKVGNVFAFVLAFLFGWLEEIGGDSNSASIKFGTSFGPATSVSYSANHIFNLEAAELGLTSDTTDLEISGYRIGFHYGMMILVFFIFMLLYVYLDQVLPSEFGVRKHPLFCLMRKKKNDQKKVSESDVKYVPDGFDPQNFEQVGDQLKNLDSSDESIKIQNLKKVYPNGKLAVDGVSFNMYPGQIFALLGHNGAGKTSTINMITGLYPISEGAASVFNRDVGTELDEIRKIMGVCPQHDVLFDQLTVQEHLELFATFKGMEKKDIKEEVDKIIKDLDLEDKRNYLSRSLSGGQKRKLSTGIAFIGPSKFILLDEPSSGMDTSARRHLWEMLKTYKHGKVVLLTTHYMDEADQLGDRIAIMGDGKLQCLGSPMFLKSKFGVGYSLTIVKEDIMDPSQPIRAIIDKHIPHAKCTSDVSAEITYQLPLDTSPKFEGMLTELDNNKTALKISSYGVSVTTLEEVFLNVSKIVHKNDVSNFNAVRKQTTQKDDEFDLKKEKIEGSWNIFKNHFSALVIKRYHYFKRDKKGLMLELFLPVLMVIIGIALTKSSFLQDPKTLDITTEYWGHENNVAYNEVLGEGGNVPSGLIDEFTPSSDFNMVEKDVDDVEEFDNMLLEERDEVSPFRKYGVYFNEIDRTSQSYSYLLLVDTRAREASSVAMNHVHNAILRYASGNDDLNIQVTNKPFPLTAGSKSIEDAVDGLSLAFIFAIGISFLPASLVTFIVKERELNVKHQQIVSGVSISAYWAANYFVDFIKYLIPGVLCCLFALAMDAAALIDGENYGTLWVLFMLYGVAITSFVYFTSFAFKDYGTAQMATFFGNFALGFIGGLAVTILRFISSTNEVAVVLHWIFRLCPTFCITYGMLGMTNKSLYARVEGFDEDTSSFDLKLSGGDILMLGITGIVYFILLFVLESMRTKKSPFSRDVPYVPQVKDSDVEKEENFVAQSKKEDFAIAVKNMRKVFKVSGKNNKVAVDNITFGIKTGECFGLLGVNGAGKTTTFKMLTGEIVPTKGEIFIGGYQVPKEMNQARMLIGYCPQFDAILENLTAREHLELYAAVKGIPHEKRAKIIDKLLFDMNLKQFENIPAGTYSGGNKRKLSVAMAMIGNPPIVFLDEPSNGMDPEARRFMWNVISKISTERKQSTVILTTHSMEEAEALSTRLAIQVDGNLKCLGSSQHIKNKYGGGYELEIKMNPPTKDEVQSSLNLLNLRGGEKTDKKKKLEEMLQHHNLGRLISQLSEEGSGSVIHSEFKRGPCPNTLIAEWIATEKRGFGLEDNLKQHFKNVSLIEHFQTFYRYRIDSDISIAKVFGYFENNKDELSIEQYSVKQTSIEQIFNAFANKAIEVKTSGQNNDHLVDIPQNNNQNAANNNATTNKDEIVVNNNSNHQSAMNNNIGNPDADKAKEVRVKSRGSQDGSDDHERK